MLPSHFPIGTFWEAQIQVMPDLIGERGGTRTLDPMIKSHAHKGFEMSATNSIGHSELHRWKWHNVLSESIIGRRPEDAPNRVK